MMDQHLRDLARAVRMGNQAEADLVLDLIARDHGPSKGDAIARGRADADKALGHTMPLPPCPAMILPMPGARPGAVLGDDFSQRVRPRDPKYQRRDRAA